MIGASLLVGVVLAVAVAGVQERGGLRRGGGSFIPFTTTSITSISYGTPYRYLNNYPTKYTQGDTWFSTAGDDGNTYVQCNDCTVPQTASPLQNMILNTVSGYAANSSTTIAIVAGNALSSWGKNSDPASDGNMSFKSLGLACVTPPGAPNGYLYMNTKRINNATYVMTTGQTIKSHDHGTSWNPQPPGLNEPYASPMFTGTPSPSDFVQYGKCYSASDPNNPVGPDNSANYVYVGMEESVAGSLHRPRRWLARIPIGVIDNLSAADWTFYQAGGSWGALSTAAVILDPSSLASTVGSCCGAIQYLPRYQSYIYFGTGDVSTGVWTLNAFQAPHPWGPWTLISGGQYQSGLVWGPIIASSIANDGQTLTLMPSGDPGTSGDPSSSSNLYSPNFLPVTLSP